MRRSGSGIFSRFGFCLIAFSFLINDFLCSFLQISTGVSSCIYSWNFEVLDVFELSICSEYLIYFMWIFDCGVSDVVLK